MNASNLSPWLMLIAGCVFATIAAIVALKCPSQWTLLILLSFVLVCFGVLSASQWFSAMPLPKGKADTSAADRPAKDSEHSLADK